MKTWLNTARPYEQARPPAAHPSQDSRLMASGAEAAVAEKARDAPSAPKTVPKRAATTKDCDVM